MIHEHATEFAGKQVITYDPDEGLKEPEKYHYRIGFGYEDYENRGVLTYKIAEFLHESGVDKISGIVIGDWKAVEETSASIVETLVAATTRLPNLKAIFLGDIIYEESEISWINQSDLSPLFLAYPQLEHFCVRGAQGLSLGRLQQESLRALIVETGGLSAEVVRQVAAADLPNLEHLELWLGTDNYGGDATMDDILPILSGKLFPKLQYLGLRDSDLSDEIAIAAAQAPITERIRVLDLSLGTLGDNGAEALLASPAVQQLEELDLHHHYLSDAMMKRFKQSGIHVDLSDQEYERDEDDRYPAVTE